MNPYRVTTASGSIYHVDPAAKTIERLPGREARTLPADGRPLTASLIQAAPVIGAPWAFAWKHPITGEWKLRTTTVVTRVEVAE